ncbi:MAG: hypothetical protein ACP6IP_05325 [Candidatus Njordarchaeia archaeon]
MVAYDGTFFYGMAKQPHLRTIESELFNALNQVGYSGKFFYMSRTDRGVHAVSQIVFLPSGVTFDLRELNYFLPHEIIVHKYQNVKGRGFRHLIYSKTYLYVAPNFDEDVSKLEWATKYISQKPHNFSTLSKRPEIKKDKVVNQIKIWFNRDDLYQFFYVEGKYFLWEQVRRIVTLIKMFALDRVSKEDFKKVLNGEAYKRGVPPAPAEGLILWRVKGDFNWRELIPESTLRRLFLDKVKKLAILYSKEWVL